MTTAKSMSSKLAVGFVAVAMLFAFSAPAQAQTVEAQIQALLAQIAALQAQLGGGMSGASVCPYTWTRDLTVGASGEDVRKLQQFLNSNAETRVAVSGAGSAGMETMTYGPLTGAAVAKFQTKYRAQILTPLNLVNATTYFGASSRAQANSLCSTATPGTGTPTGPLQGGEGYLDSESSLGDIESTLDEGETENVLGIEFEAQDSDIRIERVDVEFDLSASAGSSRLDRYIEEVTLMLDGKELDTMDAGEGSRNGQVNTFRFTGLNGIVREGDVGELYISVEAVSTIGDDEENENITVRIPANGIRAVDGSGLSETYFNSLFDEVFTISDAAAGALQLSEADSNPDIARTIEVDDTNNTSDVLLLAFELEADDQDITIFDLPIQITTAGTGSPTVTEVVQSVSLKQGSQTLKTKTIPSTATTTIAVLFDGIDFDIDAGDEETFTIVAVIKDIDGTTFQNGNTIVTSIQSNDVTWDVEDAEGESVSPTGGTVSAAPTTFRTSGIDVQFVSASESVSGGVATSSEVGTFKIVFDVTAFGENAFISATSTAATTVDYDIVGGGTEASAILTSNATKVSNSFRVNEGQTNRFTLTVAVTGNGAFNSVNLDGVSFGTSATYPHNTGVAVPLDESVFTTDPEFLSN